MVHKWERKSKRAWMKSSRTIFWYFSIDKLCMLGLTSCSTVFPRNSYKCPIEFRANCKHRLRKVKQFHRANLNLPRNEASFFVAKESYNYPLSIARVSLEGQQSLCKSKFGCTKNATIWISFSKEACYTHTNINQHWERSNGKGQWKEQFKTNASRSGVRRHSARHRIASRTIKELFSFTAFIAFASIFFGLLSAFLPGCFCPETCWSVKPR